MLENISFMRHGEKMTAADQDTISKDLEGLSVEDQQEWKEAVERLKIEDSPEIRPANIIKIREIASELLGELPENTLVLLTSTFTPRTRLTADFLSTELSKASEQVGKNIGIGYLWQSDADKKNSANPINLPEALVGSKGSEITSLMKDILAEQRPDTDPEAYLKTGGGFKVENEDELVVELVRRDLAKGDDSAIRERVQLYKDQINNMNDSVSNEERPVYVIAVGHHMSLIPLDMYANGVGEFSPEEIPQPLDRWSYDIES